ncbi:MAG TPA: hypothetical protein VEI07_15685 [Planctomycetaceae bacterium]|nr:hypothetical protein [Planctomycetaceae bacterium]
MAPRRREFAICLRNKGYEVSLERRKVYEVLPDEDATKHKQLRIVDESGEDFFYPATYFAVIDLPQTLRRVLARA